MNSDNLEDRDAAAEACELTGWKGVAVRLRAGVVFPSDYPEEKLVQLFARHRLRTQPKPAEEVEREYEKGVRAGLVMAYDKARGTNADLCKSPGQTYRLMLEAIRKEEDRVASSTVCQAKSAEIEGLIERLDSLAGLVAIDHPGEVKAIHAAMDALSHLSSPVLEIERVRDLEQALKLALAWLAPHEPGDSRAVSDEFVAMASISCGLTNQECRDIIAAALTALNAGEKGE